MKIIDCDGIHVELANESANVLSYQITGVDSWWGSWNMKHKRTPYDRETIRINTDLEHAQAIYLVGKTNTWMLLNGEMHEVCPDISIEKMLHCIIRYAPDLSLRLDHGTFIEYNGKSVYIGCSRAKLELEKAGLLVDGKFVDANPGECFCNWNDTRIARVYEQLFFMGDQ